MGTGVGRTRGVLDDLLPDITTDALEAILARPEEERPGIGVRLASEWVFGLPRNRCSTWPGARSNPRVGSSRASRGAWGQRPIKGDR